MQEWKKRDPIERFHKYLNLQSLWSTRKEAQLQEELNVQITQAIKEAEAAPPPPIESLFEDVYSEMPPHLKEQLAYLRSFTKPRQDA